MKIVIYDGLSTHVLGKALHDALLAVNGKDTLYIPVKAMKKRPFYAFRRMWWKCFQKSPKNIACPKQAKSSLNQLAKFKPDVVIVVSVIHPFFRPEWLEEYKKRLGFKLCLLDSDSANFLAHPDRQQYFAEFELPAYDQILSFSKKSSDYFNKLGFNSDFFYYSAPPAPHYNLPLTRDVVFVGTPDFRRIYFFELLNCDQLEIYGRKWANFSAMLSDDLKAKITAKDVKGEDAFRLTQEAKIMLNVNASPWYSVESGVNERVFATLASGRFLLTEYCPELEDIFVVGEEIETFRNQAECLEKIQYYLEHEEERERIAAAGYKKFLESLNWQARAKVMLELMTKEN